MGSELTRRTGATSGDLAWVASEGRTRGRYKDRDIDRITTETMILRRVGGVWRIVHVHWSSRAAADLRARRAVPAAPKTRCRKNAVVTVRP